MSRHALRHWLEVQARRAVETAFDVQFSEEESNKIVDVTNTAIPEIAPQVLAIRHEFAIVEAATALVKAELLHREIVRRGGRLK